MTVRQEWDALDAAIPAAGLIVPQGRAWVRIGLPKRKSTKFILLILAGVAASPIAICSVAWAFYWTTYLWCHSVLGAGAEISHRAAVLMVVLLPWFCVGLTAFPSFRKKFRGE